MGIRCNAPATKMVSFASTSALDPPPPGNYLNIRAKRLEIERDIKGCNHTPLTRGPPLVYVGTSIEILYTGIDPLYSGADLERVIFEWWHEHANGFSVTHRYLAYCANSLP